MDLFLKTIVENVDNSCRKTWSIMVEPIIFKIDRIMSDKFDPIEEAIVDSLTGMSQTLEERLVSIKDKLAQDFSYSPPFTVQRLAELLLRPNECYNKENPDKFLCALERVLSVSTTIDDYLNLDMKTELINSEGTDSGIVHKELKEAMLTKITFVSTEENSPSALSVNDEGTDENVTKRRKLEHELIRPEAENDKLKK